MFKKIFILILILFCTPSAYADVFSHPEKLSVIIKSLPEFNSVKCKFEQEKTMSGVVFKSSGDFEFIKDKGIVFKTTFPVQNVTSYESSQYKQINEIVNAISSGNFEKIESVFNFYFEKQGAKWVLGLVPKKSKQAEYLKSIEIEGEKNISKMIITTQNSVVTKIRFY